MSSLFRGRTFCGEAWQVVRELVGIDSSDALLLSLPRLWKGIRSLGSCVGLGVATLTPAASEVASIASMQTSFAQSAEVTLQKVCGLRLSESTVERVTEAAGTTRSIAARQGHLRRLQPPLDLAA